MISYLLLATALTAGQTTDSGAALMPPIGTAPRVAAAQEKVKPGPTPIPAVPDAEAKPNGAKKEEEVPEAGGSFLRRFIRAYVDEFKPKKEEAEETPPSPRRAMPEPWSSPPFPGSEYQGYPLIGVPESSSVYPLMKAVYGGPW
jgi:hypothetical protein